MSRNPNIHDIERRWHDPAFVLNWDVEQRKRKSSHLRSSPHESSILDFPLLSGIARSAYAPADVQARARDVAEIADGFMAFRDESLAGRACRLDGQGHRGASKQDARSAYRPPQLIAKVGEDWIISPVARAASPEKLLKAQALSEVGLTAKAQRELACGLLGGKVRCRNCHEFRTNYLCGHRYCLDCGPHAALKLFAKHLPRVKAVADALIAKHPDYVLAKIDFTRKKLSSGEMPDAEYNRELNTFICRMCRAIERKFAITREEYAMAVHDEIGGGNTNAHAHAVYVGPYLPQRWLSDTWRKICSDGSFIISIKRANNVASALWHATKYPAKFVRESTPERLAQLELSYHRVRRFRLLGAFDKRVAERVIVEREDGEGENSTTELTLGDHGQGGKCPYCDSPLHRVGGWRPLHELAAEGLPDLFDVRRNIARRRAFGSAGLSDASSRCPYG